MRKGLDRNAKHDIRDTQIPSDIGIPSNIFVLYRTEHWNETDELKTKVIPVWGEKIR